MCAFVVVHAAPSFFKKKHKNRGKVRRRRGEVSGSLASVGFLPGGGRRAFCGSALGKVTWLFRRLDDVSASELGVSAVTSAKGRSRDRAPFT